MLQRGYIVLSTAHTDHVSTHRLREHTKLACYSFLHLSGMMSKLQGFAPDNNT